MTRPRHCHPEAWALLEEQLPALETTDGLLRGAVAVSMHALPGTDCGLVERRVAGLADTVRDRVTSEHEQSYLAHLHHLLFDELGFRGNASDYYNPENSYLPVVLEKRVGLPITLSLVYKAVAERLGLRVHGVNAPAHFLVEVEEAGRPLLVDPFFRGRVTTREEAFRRIESMSGAPVERSDRLLRRASHREWLARLIRNLLAIFLRQDRLREIRAMEEMLRALE